jgi:hypothetical protein
MQRIDRRSQSIQRNIDARDLAAALADAREVGTLYDLMSGYFAQRPDAVEAVKLSRDGTVLANAIVSSLQGHDYDAASLAARSIATACRDCHIRYKPLDP